MLALTLIIHLFVGATLAGSAVILALVLGLDTLTPILIAAAVGFLVGFPISWFVAKRIGGS